MSAAARAVGASQSVLPGGQLPNTLRKRWSKRPVLPAPAGPDNKVTSGGTDNPAGKKTIFRPRGSLCQGNAGVPALAGGNSAFSGWHVLSRGVPRAA
jgi:hypothetical protein